MLTIHLNIYPTGSSRVLCFLPSFCCACGFRGIALQDPQDDETDSRRHTVPAKADCDTKGEGIDTWWISN